MKEKCAVLVTGGAGFLGQHVVGLLQTKADHVTEIRVLDLVPFENKLDYIHSKPLQSFVGSVTDEKIIKESCAGVQSVIHLAGIPDSRMFPDKKRISDVNIQGTLLTLLTALDTSGIKRFIYCSSMAVAIGDSDVTEDISENDPIPSRRLFEPYASSKLSGEHIVLAANSESFRTVSIRPLAMWGELDTTYVQLSQRMAAWTFGYLPTVNLGDVVHHSAYVGNTAWGFVCAEEKLHMEFKNDKTSTKAHYSKNEEHSKSQLCSELRRRSKRIETDPRVAEIDLKVFNDMDSDCKKMKDNVYYITDDTQPGNIFKSQEPFLNATGYGLVKYPCPLLIIVVVFHIMYGVILLLRFFGLKINFPVTLGICAYYKRSYTFCDIRARKELGYKPIYTFKESMVRSLKYYKQFSFKRS